MAGAATKKRSALAGGGPEAETAIAAYLKEKNRPFSVNDIVLNLRNAYSKTVVQKALTSLVSKGEVVEKQYNKQIVFVASQEGPAPTPEELDAMDEQLGNLKTTLDALIQEQKELSDTYQKLLAIPDETTLFQRITELTSQCLDAVGAIAEGLSMRPSEVMEMIDIENPSAASPAK